MMNDGVGCSSILCVDWSWIITGEVGHPRFLSPNVAAISIFIDNFDPNNIVIRPLDMYGDYKGVTELVTPTSSKRADAWRPAALVRYPDFSLE